MEIIEMIREYAWILVLFIALAVIWLTYTKMKGTPLFRIGFGLFRAVLFFGIFYNPLMNQPRIGTMSMPISGCIVLLLGIILNVIGTKELVKTKLGGVKGIPDRIITTGIYRIIRHPINLGFMLIFCGWYVMWAGIYSLYFLPVLIILFIIVSFYEEKNLIKVFGEEYQAYKKEVGMFIPKIKPGEKK
jgi:methanethiol S-methyltransferase